MMSSTLHVGSPEFLSCQKLVIIKMRHLLDDIEVSSKSKFQNILAYTYF